MIAASERKEPLGNPGGSLYSPLTTDIRPLQEYSSIASPTVISSYNNASVYIVVYRLRPRFEPGGALGGDGLYRPPEIVVLHRAGHAVVFIGRLELQNRSV